eukprot:superscaffoldBa00001091_g8918
MQTLTLACLFRYNVLSLVYFLYVLLLPWFLCPNKHTIRGHTGRFIKVVFCTSLLFVLAHICFQTVLYTYPPLNIAIGDNCSQWDSITRHIGLSRYRGADHVVQSVGKPSLSSYILTPTGQPAPRHHALGLSPGRLGFNSELQHPSTL